jgi:hypothetical protein
VRAALDSAYADGQLDGAEHRTRSEAATAAKTITELQELVRDLQVPEYLAKPPEPATPSEWLAPTLTEPVPPKWRPFARFAADIRGIFVLISVFALVLGINRPDLSDNPPLPTPGISAIASDPRVDPFVAPRVALHTPEGFRRFVEAVRAEFDPPLRFGAVSVHHPARRLRGRAPSVRPQGSSGGCTTSAT